MSKKSFFQNKKTINILEKAFQDNNYVIIKVDNK